MVTFFMQLTIAEVKAEMEKTLEWLVPVATNTTKYVPINQLVFLSVIKKKSNCNL